MLGNIFYLSIEKGEGLGKEIQDLNILFCVLIMAMVVCNCIYIRNEKYIKLLKCFFYVVLRF